MIKLFERFKNDETGATAIEYALIAAIVGISIVASLGAVRNGLIGEFTATAEALSEANSQQ
jgi:pilus assembly protein Flp/PilA